MLSRFKAKTLFLVSLRESTHKNTLSSYLLFIIFFPSQNYPISLEHLQVCQDYENETTNDHLVSKSWISTYSILAPITVIRYFIIIRHLLLSCYYNRHSYPLENCPKLIVVYKKQSIRSFQIKGILITN